MIGLLSLALLVQAPLNGDSPSTHIELSDGNDQLSIIQHQLTMS
jgi:hypothetical protein